MQKITEVLIDDLDGSESADVTTVQFGLDGVTYEIDLTERNAELLRGVLTEYVAKGRRTGGRIRRGGSAASSGNDASQIRDWARENGIELAARGRIPADVTAKYRAAQTSPKKVAAASKRTTTKKAGTSKRRPAR